MSRHFPHRHLDPEREAVSAEGDEFMRRAALAMNSVQYPGPSPLLNRLSGYPDNVLDRLLASTGGSKPGSLLTRALVRLIEAKAPAELLDGFAATAQEQTLQYSYELYANLTIYRRLTTEPGAKKESVTAYLSNVLKAFANYATKADSLFAPPLPGLTTEENALLTAMTENPGRIAPLTATVMERSGFNAHVIEQVIQAPVPELSKGAL